MRRVFSCLSMVSIAVVLASASARGDDPIGDVLERVLGGVPPGAVPSGILHDRVLSLAEIGQLDGSAAAPAIDAARWRQAWWEMRRAAGDAEPLEELSILRARVRASAPGVIPVGVLDFRYDRLRRDATGLRAVEVLGAGSPLDPAALESAGVFAAAALVGSTSRGSTLRFDLAESWRFGNRGERPVRQWLDADDGAGWREVGAERVEVRYVSPGPKRPRLRVEGANGSVREAAFDFVVDALAVPSPTDTLRVTASRSFDGAVAAGDAWIYLADGRSALTRPVVLVEGFDLDNSLNWDEIYALLNTGNLLEDIRAAGYDLVVLNFDDATDHIQRNGLLVVEVLEAVQSMIDPAARYTVAGASMGALCTRYALSWMEQNGVEHRAGTWISFDGPHRGANIPLGLQYWLDFFSGESADAAFLLSRLDRPAARQLLVYHHTDPPAPTGAADPLRAAFEDDLAALGGYPQLPRRVAIANGSGTSADQGYAAGAQLLQWSHDSWLVDIRGNVWAVPDGSGQRIFEGLIDPVFLSPTVQEVQVSGTEPFDSAPGGSRASLAQADATEAPYGDIVALQPVHCFIPTISALDLPAASLFFDVSAEADPAALSPFDVVYFPAENQDHVLVTAENAQWFRDELLAAPTGIGAVPGPGLALHGNRPNPFNPATRIEYDLGQPGRVRVEVYDARGARVAVLLDADRPAGRSSVLWNGRDSARHPVSSGVYFCRVEAAGIVRATSMVLLK